MREQLQNSLVRYGKIYQDIGFIFLLGKFLDECQDGVYAEV